MPTPSIPTSASSLPGNAPTEAKQTVLDLMQLFFGHGASYTAGFALPVARRLAVAEVGRRAKADAAREEWVVVMELDVDEDMLNGGGSMHGGCTAFLIDICTSIVLGAAGRGGTVSQAINTVYHAPAPAGCHLRIVNTTMTVGARISSARCE
ncbi:hypothetical protein OF83DRAFT_1087457, partial [Amylostereum chailletii]